MFVAQVAEEHDGETDQALSPIAFRGADLLEQQLESMLAILPQDSGVKLYSCKASVDMFGLTMENFVPQVEDIISVGEFYERAAGGEITFT